jgi:hypothetical protein
MAHDALAIFRPKRREIAPRLSLLFGLRYMLDRYGYDPCDEWDIDTLLQLPEGLEYRSGQIQYQCRVCERWTELPVDATEFELDDPHNMCGRSPSCCP